MKSTNSDYWWEERAKLAIGERKVYPNGFILTRCGVSSWTNTWDTDEHYLASLTEDEKQAILALRRKLIDEQLVKNALQDRISLCSHRAQIIWKWLNSEVLDIPNDSYLTTNDATIIEGIDRILSGQEPTYKWNREELADNE